MTPRATAVNTNNNRNSELYLALRGGKNQKERCSKNNNNMRW